MSRWLIALVVASLGAGGWLGWTLRGEPPVPEVRQEEKVKADLGIKESATATAKANTASVQTIGPSEIKRKATKYHPPAPLPGCTDGKAPCNCPAPALGPVAEVLEETVNTGPGSIAISSNQESTAVSSRELKLLQELETLRSQKPPKPAEAPRFTLGLGAAMSPMADERKLAPAVSLGARVYKHYTLRVAADVPVLSPKEARASLWLELPL